MEPWMSWIMALSVGGGLAFYYTRTNKSKPARTAPEPAQPTASRRRQEKRTRDDAPDAAVTTSTDVSTSVTATEKKRKGPKQQDKPKPAPAAAASFAAVAASEEPADFVDDDDKAWAQQLNATQKGVDLKSVSKTDVPRAKSNKKKQRPTEMKDSDAWPESGDQITAPASNAAGDVSDMLEAVTPGPSVLRLTGEEKAKKQAPAKAEPAKETKKQRQNRRKVEEKKAAQDATEAQRKVLAEQQRRGAREARGEPAKNGVPVPAAPAGAWTQVGNAPAKTNGRLQPAEATLLDTFDHEALSATSSNEPHTSATTPATAASTLGAHDESEDRQMNVIPHLNDESSGWNEVGKSKKGKKKAAGSPPAEPSVKELHTYSSTRTDELVNGETKAPGLPVKETKPSNPYDTLSYTTSFAPGTGPRHPQDSDWAA